MPLWAFLLLCLCSLGCKMEVFTNKSPFLNTCSFLEV